MVTQKEIYLVRQQEVHTTPVPGEYLEIRLDGLEAGWAQPDPLACVVAIVTTEMQCG